MNLLVTMLLGGLWHGAGWTFVIWGALHGIYLVINHALHYLKKNTFLKFVKIGRLSAVLSRVITFLAIVVAWVFFRAETLSGAINMLKGMLGEKGFILPVKLSGNIPDFWGLIQFAGKDVGAFGDSKGLLWLLVLSFIVWFMPNTREWVVFGTANQNAVGIKRVFMLPGILWAIIIGLAGLTAVVYLNDVSEFLYFNF